MVYILGTVKPHCDRVRQGTVLCRIFATGGLRQGDGSLSHLCAENRPRVGRGLHLIHALLKKNGSLHTQPKIILPDICLKKKYYQHL